MNGIMVLLAGSTLKSIPLLGVIQLHQEECRLQSLELRVHYEEVGNVGLTPLEIEVGPYSWAKPPSPPLGKS